ncbi:hypothetical protein [Phycicoccus sp.]|uniref:lipopolysaccharide biosynthesis protein n=1 Tax=Phycicoccus sp. TaxID=1902410 RepID=UPI002D1FAF25|nr:hypothetical protein [Phycicoccus sp.]
MATSAVSRGVAAVAPIVTVPLALRALGASGYGAWSSALSLTALAVWADLGLGAGLMTRLAASMESGDMDEGRRLVSSAYAAVCSVALVLLVGLAGSAAFLDWGAVVAGDEGRGSAETEAVVLVTLAAFTVGIAANLIVRVQYASKQIGRSNSWQAAGTAAGVVAIFIAARAGIGGAGFVAVAAFVPPATALINTVHFFRGPLGHPITPRVTSVHRRTVRELLGLGLGFLAITMLMAIGISLDTWIVGRTTSLADAAEFSVLLRVLTVVGTLVSVLSIPLWPNYAAALRARDHDWIRRSTRRMLVLSPALVGATSVLAVLVLPLILPRWLGPSFHADLTAAWGLAAWNVVQALAAPLFMVQNAAGALRPQLVGYALLTVIVPIKWAVSVHFGYGWVPLVTTIGYLVVMLPAAVVGYRLAMRTDLEPVGVVA